MHKHPNANSHPYKHLQDIYSNSQAGPTQTNTCDLVMLLNTKFSSEENFKKFSGFVIGLLKYVLGFFLQKLTTDN